MKRLILVLLLAFLVPQLASAGELWGRILQEEGQPLANKNLTIDGSSTRTNEYGSYKVELRDGERQLTFKIGSTEYTSDRVRIYSPRTKQNWKVDGNRMRKVN